MLKQYEDKWLGDKKVKFAEEVGENAGGIRLVKLTYDNGQTEEYTQKMLDAEGVVTPNPQDLTAFREARVVPVVRECLETLRNFSLKEKEMQYAIMKLTASIAENVDKATCILFGVETPQDWTMGQVDKILLGKKTLKDVLGNG